jgi:hypothetical protein
VGCDPLSKQLFCKLKPAQVLQGGPAQDVIPLQIHCQDLVVSGEARRLYKEGNSGCKFSDFWLKCCQYFSGFSFNEVVTLLLANLRAREPS